MKNTIKYSFALLTLMLGVTNVSAEVTLKNISGKKLEAIVLMPNDVSKRVRNLGFNKKNPVEKNAAVKFTINPQDNPFTVRIIDDRGEAINFPNVAIDQDANIELITTPEHVAILEVKTGNEVQQYEQEWILEKKEGYSFVNKTNKAIERIAVSSVGSKDYNAIGRHNPLKAGENRDFQLPASFNTEHLNFFVLTEQGQGATFENIKIDSNSKNLVFTEDAGGLHLSVQEYK